ncbi:hypothetical protein LAZ67_3004702 [Cordylochernes scorpioides]|uniref:Integrase catalytic domain-containing protein n=1 Tax=Cordylochernes scorpioides TaxID=51811 RepID=A0ABY6K9P8_9ARAC|nr:hypothetical protein LAZ67_3004702 [Cordylochernes scorpioides]
MALSLCIRKRAPVRSQVTRISKEIISNLRIESKDYFKATVGVRRILDLQKVLLSSDKEIIDILAEDDEADLEKEMDDCAHYQEIIIEAIVAYEDAQKQVAKEVVVQDSFMDTTEKIRLPTIELPKFSGNLMDWLTFWAQFEKIHLDIRLKDSDKFYYLLQSLSVDTEAYKIVSIYPLTDENYSKAIDALRRRYANPDLLLQIYVRELLKLVIDSASGKKKLSFHELYYRIQSYLGSLKSLNLESASPDTWLYPLVESCLSDELLLAWQRRSQFVKLDVEHQTRLDQLMDFLEKEILIQQNIQLAKGGFRIAETSDQERKKGFNKKKNDIPTVTGLQQTELGGCIFCEKKHASQNCFAAKKMSLEEKRKVIREKKVCFKCLKGRHLARYCRTKVRCYNCGSSHFLIMCTRGDRNNKEAAQLGIEPELTNQNSERVKQRVSHRENSESFDATVKPNEDLKRHNDCSNQVCQRNVALQTLMLNVIAPKGRKLVRAFLDSGSQHTYILKTTAEELGLKPVTKETVHHALFGGMQTTAVTHSLYDVQLKADDENFVCKVTVRDQSKICQALPRIPKTSLISRELEQRKIKVTDLGNDNPPIELLIGADIYGKLMTGKTLQLDCGLTAMLTHFGWTLLGSLKEWSEEENSMMVMSMNTMFGDARQDFSISQLWDLDTIGVRDPVEVKSSVEQETAFKNEFLKNISRNKDGRYVVPLPWIEGHPPLPTNEIAAHKRLVSTTRKLKTSSKYGEYDYLFREWKREGLIENVNKARPTEIVHYLPHRPVYKESASTPVRPVFDASCKVDRHPSLNDCLWTGSNCVKKIMELLMRFREKRIGFTADIRRAFQTIEVREEDRDAMRFLWWQNQCKNQVQVYRHTRVMFGATCSPFILGTVLEYHLTHVNIEDSRIAEKLLNSFYIDNSVGSEDSLESYLAFKEKSIQLLRDAKMDLRMWQSNAEEFQHDTEAITMILGVRWDRRRDLLSIDTGKIDLPSEVTKRTILSTVQRIFDPFGILGPALMPMKSLLQRTWIQKIKWDTPIIGAEKRSFEDWCKNVPLLAQLKFPRAMIKDEIDKRSWSLHLFTDASRTAYSAVVFLRVENEEIQVSFMSAKTRVTPMKREILKKNKKTGESEMIVKEISIPRLELIACLIGSRLLSTVKRSLNITDIKEFYWTDSTAVLAWIKREEIWNTFEGNRIREIRELTFPNNWRHIQGTKNPADLPSRGCLCLNFYNLNEMIGEIQVDKERKKSSVEMIQDSVLINFNVIQEVRYDYTYSQYVRIMGWILRFIYNLRNNGKHFGRLLPEEVKMAELQLIRGVQVETFSDPDSLRGYQIKRSEDGILRVKTRLTFREDLEDYKSPILLPRKHPLVKKLIEEYHLKFCHAGVLFLMNELREKYWILQSRIAVKRVVRQCVTCRRLTAKSVITEEVPLPKERIMTTNVFEIIGVDLTGPLYLKGQAKVWIVIYTCSVYRAVHLDLVNSLSTKTFIQSLERFIRIYGRPTMIFSDNGRNFVGTDNFFQQIDWKTLQESDCVRPIKWRFNPPFAAWWGGWWERLIRSMKNLLKRTLGKATLRKEQLAKMLEEVQSIMNGRPLTYVSEEMEDPQPLTPAMFLRHKGNIKFPEGDLTEKDRLQFSYAWRKSLEQELKNRFRSEYLSHLINKNKGKNSHNLRIGDIVVIGSDLRKRTEWPLGRIIELYPGKDGIVRVAKLKTGDGIIIRPVQRLCPMELDFSKEYSNRFQDSTNEIRAVIKYLCKKGMSPKEIYEDMVDTLREDNPSYSTVKNWVAAFKLGRISTEDRPGRLVESVTQENIDKIHDLIMLDKRLTVRQIEETLGFPKTTVDRIMRKHLGLRKISARWVPKPLTPDQKAVRGKLSSDNLALFEANPEEFVNRFVTMDETWAHHFTPESKQQSMQWRHSGSPPPKKAKTVPSAGKGQTITGNYYANLVKQLREAIKEKSRGKLSRKIVYHQDNAPSHRSLQAMAAIYDSGFELLPHAPYSPDLAPSDFHLFLHLKKSLSDIHFRSDEESNIRGQTDICPSITAPPIPTSRSKNRCSRPNNKGQTYVPASQQLQYPPQEVRTNALEPNNRGHTYVPKSQQLQNPHQEVRTDVPESNNRGQADI